MPPSQPEGCQSRSHNGRGRWFGNRVGGGSADIPGVPVGTADVSRKEQSAVILNKARRGYPPATVTSKSSGPEFVGGLAPLPHPVQSITLSDEMGVPLGSYSGLGIRRSVDVGGGQQQNQRDIENPHTKLRPNEPLSDPLWGTRGNMGRTDWNRFSAPRSR